MADGNGSIFRGGVPYGPDLQRLTEAFPVPSLTEGLIIPHEHLEAILGMKRGGHRYYALVNSWVRKQKNENAVIIVWESKVGLKVLDPASFLMHAETGVRQKSGQLLKRAKLFAWIRRERLDSTGQNRYDHDMRVNAVMVQAVTSARKDLAIELAPIKSLPKPRIVKAG